MQCMESFSKNIKQKVDCYIVYAYNYYLSTIICPINFYYIEHLPVLYYN